MNRCGADLWAAGLAVRERLLPRVLPSPPDGKRARKAAPAVLWGPGQAAQRGHFVAADSIAPTHCKKRKQGVCREGEVYLTQPCREVGDGRTELGGCLPAVALTAP